VRQDDKRLIVAAICLVTASLAFALLQPHSSLAVWSEHVAHDCYWPQWRPHLSRKNCATVVVMVGSFIAFYGLLRAYVRSKYDQTIFEWIFYKRRWGDITIVPATAIGHLELSGMAHATFTLDPKQTVREQLKALAQFVNDRSAETDGLQKALTEIGREIRKLRTEASELERKTLEHIESRIDQLDSKINRTQVLDLTLAIWGLFITTIGIALGLGA
jgi:hypothetical protein